MSLPLILASASPRRRDLLTSAGLTFEVDPAGVDESLTGGETPEEAAVLLARRKAESVAERRSEPALVIGSDTVVAVTEDGIDRLLGKPEDAAEARAMLSSLSGSRHRVVTGVAVVRLPDRAVESGFERTWVTMRPLTEAEIDAYVASGEWEDKAGGYAIQENADAFVTLLEEGGFDNVVGLPVRLTLELVSGLAGPGTGS